MRSTFKRALGIAMAGSVVCLLGARSAKAGVLNIYLSEAGVDGGTPQIEDSVATSFPTAGIANGQFTGQFGDFYVDVVTSESINIASQSDLISATTSVLDNGVPATLSLYITETDYALPAGSSLFMTSQLGGSINTPTLGLTGIFQGYADASDAVLGMGGFSTGPQSATANGQSFDTGTASGFFNRSGNFSLTSVATLSMGSGALVNYSDNVRLTAAPLPATVWSGSAIFGLLGVSQIARRFKPSGRKIAGT
jgi:hypothetical protein